MTVTNMRKLYAVLLLLTLLTTIVTAQEPERSCVEILVDDFIPDTSTCSIENRTVGPYTDAELRENNLLDGGYCCGLANYDVQRTYIQNRVTRAGCQYFANQYEDITFTPAEPSSSYEAVCQATSNTTYTFTGTAINSSNQEPLPQTTINISINDEVRTATTDTDGSYRVSITTNPGSQYTITANHEKCEILQPIEGSLDRTTNVENTVQLCDTNTEPTEPQPQRGLCGNEELNEGEECEPNIDREQVFSEEYQNTQCPTDQTGNVYCTDQCTVANTCQPTDTPQSSCAQLANQENLTVQTNLDIGNEETTLTADWSLTSQNNCQPGFSTFKVLNPDGDVIYSITGLQDNTYQHTFPNDELRDSEEHTVQVTAIYSGVRRTGTTPFTPYILCNDRGLNPGETGTFCIEPLENGDNLLTCNPNGTAETSQCQEGCTTTSRTTAQCSTTTCQQCSGPFNLFSSLAQIVLNTDSTTNTNTTTCNTQYQQNLCYYEPTSVQFAVRGNTESCGDITSCASYKSQATCTDNPCQMQFAEQCEWINNGPLGDGYCVGETPQREPATCTACGSTGCTETVCEESLGNSQGQGTGYCYYNEDAIYNPETVPPTPQGPEYDRHRCMPRDQAGCETYNTEQSCTGDTEMQRNPDTMTLTPSQDELGYGVCKWGVPENENQQRPPSCYRDSDDNNAADCPTSLGNQRTNCIQDTNPPHTTLTGIENNARIPKPVIAELTRNVRDQETSTDTIQTTYTAGQQTFQSLAEVKDYIDDEAPQTHTIRYWSEDKHHNVEQPKTLTVTITDDIAAVLQLTATHTTYTVGNANALTNNITATFTQPEAQFRPLTCNVALINAQNTDETLRETTREITSPQHNVVFQDIKRQGDYNVRAECTDAYGRTANVFATLSIDLDPTITNPKPHVEAVQANQELTISIETEQPRTCEYKQSQTPWTPYTETGGQTHSATITTQSQGHHEIQTRCQNGTKYLYGDSVDDIVYTVDTQPPEVRLESRAGLAQNELEEQNEVDVEVICNDQPTNFGRVANAGCSETYTYCYNATGECTPQTQTIGTGFTMRANPDQTVEEEARVTIADRFGNEETGTYTVDLLDTSLTVEVDITING